MSDIESSMYSKDQPLRHRKNQPADSTSLHSHEHDLNTKGRISISSVERHRRLVKEINEADSDDDDEEARQMKKRISRQTVSSSSIMIKVQIAFICILILILISVYVSLIYLRPTKSKISTDQVSNIHDEDSVLSSLTKILGNVFGGKSTKPIYPVVNMIGTTSLTREELEDCVYPSFWSSASLLHKKYVVPQQPKYQKLKNVLHQSYMLERKGVIIDLYDKERIRSSLHDEVGYLCQSALEDSGNGNDSTILDQYDRFGEHDLSEAQMWLWRMCMIYTGQKNEFVDLDNLDTKNQIDVSNMQPNAVKGMIENLTQMDLIQLQILENSTDKALGLGSFLLLR